MYSFLCGSSLVGIINNIYQPLLCRYIVIKPYGKKFEANRDGLQLVLKGFQDVLQALKFANDLGIVHRDVSYGNIVLHDGCGYLIDWGAASYSSQKGDLTATLLFASLRVCYLHHEGMNLCVFLIARMQSHNL